MNTHLNEPKLRKLLSAQHLLTPLVEKALQQAKRSHEHHKRDSGASYLEEHIYPVTSSVLEHYTGEHKDKVVATALLHDVLEDDPHLDREQFAKDFAPVISWVEALTKPAWKDAQGTTMEEKKHVAFSAYLKQLNAAPQEVKLIKCLDLLNNITHMTLATPARRASLLRKFDVAYLEFIKTSCPFLYERIKEKHTIAKTLKIE
ncbi:MAG: HD domain-containing protein [archaeon]